MLKQVGTKVHDDGSVLPAMRHVDPMVHVASVPSKRQALHALNLITNTFVMREKLGLSEDEAHKRIDTSMAILRDFVYSR
jgi:hypothetical protein